MKYVIAGPDRHYRWSVHKVGCKDLIKLRHLDLWTVDLGEPATLPEVAYEAARAIYEDQVTDYGWTEETHPAECREYWEGCTDDIRPMPCTGLPRKAAS